MLTKDTDRQRCRTQGEFFPPKPWELDVEGGPLQYVKYDFSNLMVSRFMALSTVSSMFYQRTSPHSSASKLQAPSSVHRISISLVSPWPKQKSSGHKLA